MSHSRSAFAELFGFRCQCDDPVNAGYLLYPFKPFHIFLASFLGPLTEKEIKHLNIVLLYHKQALDQQKLLHSLVSQSRLNRRSAGANLTAASVDFCCLASCDKRSAVLFRPRRRHWISGTSTFERSCSKAWGSKTVIGRKKIARHDKGEDEETMMVIVKKNAMLMIDV